MTDKVWTIELQNKLKQTRVDAAISAEALAHYCIISPAQMLQLEEGGERDFYSPAIKYQTGIKTLNMLERYLMSEQNPASGLPPPLTLHNTPPESFNASVQQRLDRVAHIQPVAPKSKVQNEPVERIGSRVYLLGAILMACISLFLVFEYDLQMVKHLNQQQNVHSAAYSPSATDTPFSEKK